MVDGAWLYGLLPRWHDARYAHLIQTYLEELGEGVPDRNHVVIYRSLLTAHGCDQWQHLDDDYFVQGTLQLALAHHAAHFLPEVIGFNLGYEQLPLHLLISAYELNELGIDPYYFTLHVTVDNAASGHATKALQGLFDSLPHIADKDDFYRRVTNGYKLSAAGVGTQCVIDGFDLDDEVLTIFLAKPHLVDLPRRCQRHMSEPDDLVRNPPGRDLTFQFPEQRLVKRMGCRRVRRRE